MWLRTQPVSHRCGHQAIKAWGPPHGCARNDLLPIMAAMTSIGMLTAPGALGQTVTHRLHSLTKLTDRASQAAYLAEAGLPLGEGRCLSAIGSFQPLSVKDLATRANLDKAQASRAAQALVDQGLVRKGNSHTDGRGVVLTLTAKGRRRWERVMALIERRNADIVACLNSPDRAHLDRLLDRLVAHARQLAGNPSD
jgi:DNA-binding MarR family transcriptional regulator